MAKTTATRGRIVVRDEDYDEERARPVHILACAGHARLGKRRKVTVNIQQDPDANDGEVYFGLELQTPDTGDGGDAAVFGVTLKDLLTISATLEQTIAAAQKRGIVRG